MSDNICFTYGALLFFTVFMLVYFMKKKINNGRNKIFICIVITVEILLLSEISMVYFDIGNYNYLIKKIFWIIHWSSCNLCFYFLFLYVYHILNKLNTSSLIQTIKYNKLTQIISILTLIEIICEFILFPYNEFKVDDISFIHIPTRIYCIITSILIIIILYLKNKNITKEEKYSIYFASIMCIIFVLLQLFFEKISFIPIGVVIVTLNLYFNAENSDLLILRNINDITNNINNSNSNREIYLNKMKNEIISPITNIKNLSSELSLMKKFNNQDYYNLINQFIYNGENLLNIVNKSFDMISLENNQNNISKPYSFKDILYKLYFYANSKIKKGNITFNFDVDNNISSMFIGNENYLYLALKNVIDVCFEKTYVGKVTFTFSSIKVNNEEKINIEITDTSDGFNDNEIESINNKKELNSLLQSIVLSKKYINDMGGTFEFTSQKNVGNKFNIKILQHIYNDIKIGIFNASILNEIKYNDLNKYNIAIVDDNELNLKIISKMIDKYNNKCELFNDAKSLINSIKLGNKYDLILMDINMPEISGEYALEVINDLTQTKKIPIIAITANGLDIMKEYYLSKGFANYLIKPFNKYELDTALKNIFKDEN